MVYQTLLSHMLAYTVNLLMPVSDMILAACIALKISERMKND